MAPPAEPDEPMTQSAKPVPFRYYFEYFLVRLLRGILLCMPVAMASFLMGKIWRLLGPLNNRHARVLRHMEWALSDQTAPDERRILARAMWENLGRTFCEGLIADRIIRDKNRFDANNAAFRHWNEECRDGALLVTHHFGNWELTSAPTVLFTEHKIMGIYRRVKNPLVEDFFLKIRSPLYPGGLFSHQRGAARQAVARMKAGSDMAMVADLRDNRGLKVNSFGMPASVSNFPEMLALKYDKPLFVAQLRRRKGVDFVLDMQQIEIPRTDDIAHDCQVMTQAVHSQFEEWIRKKPDQWMWAPYRWSGRHDTAEKPLTWNQFMAGTPGKQTENLDN